MNPPAARATTPAGIDVAIEAGPGPSAVATLAVWRLNLLRAGYALLVAGLGATIWPAIVDPASSWPLMQGVVVCMLGALSALALFGLRYPLRMLPLLFFELAWKAIWLLRIALPLALGHRLDGPTTETAFECLMAIVFLAIIPWHYVVDRCLREPGDPWRGRPQPYRA